MKCIISCIAIFIQFNLFAQSQATEAPVVQTASGTVRGVHFGNIDNFKGIPFAAPPTGPLRWRPPQPPKQWDGVLEASQFGADCAQTGWPPKPGSIAVGSSEDCLYLNIWRPAGAKSNRKLPVLVWIHGGAFVHGSGAQPDFSGAHFAEQQLLLLTFNYRLGRLGFFAHPALSKEFPDEPKGNYGYMDQIAALQWVQQNIEAFGGDPGNVTIFGESAGGVSVHSMLTIPAAKGLFHKAILQSSGGRDGILSGRPLDADSTNSFYPVSAERVGMNFAHRHHIEGTDSIAVAQLRALSVDEIVDGGAENDWEGGPRIYSGPIVDNKLVVETFMTAYRAGRFPKIPIMIGSNSAEMQGPFVVNAASKEELFDLFGNLKNEASAVYDPFGARSLTELLSMINTDRVWAEPARFMAQAWIKKSAPAYVYLFSFVPDSLRSQMPYGASHGSEIAYVFNNLETRRGLQTQTTIDREVANRMHTYWANFAKTGNPNGIGQPEWPVFHRKKHTILEFQSDGKAVAKPDPRKKRLDVIEKEINSGKLQKNGV
ncbi:MAG: carboxylesterase family protein [Saprospiraceae bacterium]|nr:carboxylesterase family protein [Saprospiraceae bacterium]